MDKSDGATPDLSCLQLDPRCSPGRRSHRSEPNPSIFRSQDFEQSNDSLESADVAPELGRFSSALRLTALEKARLKARHDVGMHDLVFDTQSSLSTGKEASERQDEVIESKAGKPFHRWMRSLHRRAVRRQRLLGSEDDPSPYQFDSDGPTWPAAYHRESSSNSSFGFVTGVRSASISLASGSLLTRSRRNTVRSSRGHSRTDWSSRASLTGIRLSEDSTCMDRPVSMDPTVAERSFQRRRILEELITTEESYIGDIRFLMNVYVTILASLPTIPVGLRSSINRNLTDIVELHEEMLRELHRVVPNSEYTQLDVPLPGTDRGIRGHHRWRSLGAVPEQKSAILWLQDVPGMVADPQVAAEVARLFAKKMNRFFIYEEYGAKYELMIKDVASAHRSMPQWESYQKGLEALAASLGSVHSQADDRKKSLTIGDLLVKPIQRICKYPLLFAELLKHTPVFDCPYSHMEIENTLVRLREATSEINRATDDSRIRAVLQKTWILQDRLTFADQKLDAGTKHQIRAFGHVQLCGALYVCWQTKEGVTGQYMAALLYREWLCLATASRTNPIYTIKACVALHHVKVEEVDNGRGLQCHTAPYSWKLVFICDHQLYEVILTACNPKEELEWRTRLSIPAERDDHDPVQPAFYSSLTLNIKSLGTVFGKPGTIARRISIHRATTVGPKSPLCQVILKNTSVAKDGPSPLLSSQINRSQSLLTTNGRVPVLTPSRAERARLEALLADVWTRDLLPFPGMTARSRSEHLVRAGASSVMRKLSVASITNSFAKRSASMASLQKTSEFEECAHSLRQSQHGRHEAESSEARGRSLLSVILDEGERHSPAAAAVESEWGADVLRAVHQLEPTMPCPEQAGEAASTLTLTSATKSRPASPLSLHSASQQNSLFTKTSTCDSEKEGGHVQAAGACKTRSSHRITSKWSRMQMLHREAVVQSIRSIFR